MNSAPVQPQERIQYLDVIRGFAITGVLLAYVFWNLGTIPESAFTSPEKNIDAALAFLIDSKCYTLLANLFAVGFVLHMNKAADKKASLHTYRRRLVGLMIIGALHAILLRNGDILLPYAILMMIVSFLYTASGGVILLAIVGIFLLQVVMPELFNWLHLGIPGRPDVTGNYWVENFAWVKYWYASAIFYWETTLCFLLSGFLIGRYFIQYRKTFSNRTLVFLAVTGWISGSLAHWVLTDYGEQLTLLPDIGDTHLLRKLINNLLWMVHRCGLAITYAILFYGLLKRYSLKVLAVLGRTSLSNYILQAVIVVPAAIAFHLFDNIRPYSALVITIVIWIIQVIVSTWWLKHHRFGPLEWWLRQFTYGKMAQ